MQFCIELPFLDIGKIFYESIGPYHPAIPRRRINLYQHGRKKWDFTWEKWQGRIIMQAVLHFSSSAFKMEMQILNLLTYATVVKT